MVVNIYDTANEMERQMRETQEFQALKEAFAELKKDEDAFGTFQKFQEKQMQAQQKQMQGVQLTEEEIKKVQDLAKEVGQKDAIKNLMVKERQLDDMIQQISKTITAPIAELYREAMPEQNGGAEK